MFKPLNDELFATLFKQKKQKTKQTLSIKLVQTVWTSFKNAINLPYKSLFIEYPLLLVTVKWHFIQEFLTLIFVLQTLVVI